MSTFLTESLRVNRRLCDHARANLALSNEVYISGNVFFLTGDRFQVYHLF